MNNYIYAKLKPFPTEENTSIIDLRPNNLISINVIEECDPLSLTLPACSYDLEISIEDDIEALLENGACFDVFRRRGESDNLLFTAIVSSYQRKDKTHYSVQCADYIAYLGKFTYYGRTFDMLNEDLAKGDFVKEIVDDITSIANVNQAFEVDDHIYDVDTGYLQGTIKTTNCRDALKMFLFAVNAYAVSEFGKIKIKKLTIPAHFFSINKERLIDHEQLTKKEKISKINLIYYQHSLTASREEPKEIYNFYDTQKHIALIALEERPQSVSRKIGDSTDYLFIDCETQESLERGNALVAVFYDGIIPESGVEDPSLYSAYAHSYNTFTNGATLEINDQGEEMDITDLQIHSDGVTPDAKLKAFFLKNEELNVKIIDSYHKHKYGGNLYGTIKYGDYFFDTDYYRIGAWVSYASKYSGEIDGMITKQTYNLNGNVIIKDTVVKRIYTNPV